MNINDITYTSLETITAFDIVTGEYLFTLDELQSATIANSEDKEDITGKGGRKLNSLKKNKTVTVSGTNGLVSGGLLALQTGGEFKNVDDAPVQWTDYLVINGDKAATAYKAVGTLGNEIENVYVKNTDGTLGKKLTQDATPGAGTFAYDPKTKEITFNAGDYADGTEVVAYYMRNITASVVDNVSDTYSKKCKLYIDAFGEDKCNNTYRIQFYIPRADFSGTFDIALGDSQTVHSFEAESLAGSGGSACHGGSNAIGSSGTLWTYTVFGANADDYVTGDEHMKIPEAGAQPGGISGKQVSDLLDDDVNVAWSGIDGVVTGTLKKVDSWTEFSDNDEEQSGHYFPVSLDSQYAGKPITVIGSTTKTETDTEWVLRVDKCKKFTFKCDGEVILTLDFFTATMPT